MDEKTGINYTLYGDYYLPDLELKEQEEANYGKYGILRKNFLKEHRSGLYSSYLLTGKLTAHLTDYTEPQVMKWISRQGKSWKYWYGK